MKDNLQDLNLNLEKKVKDRTNELAEKNKILEELDQQKSSFFTNLSHEIKTPLTLISNYLDRYIDIHGATDELTIVKRNIDKLTQDMINFFDVLKIEKGIGIYDNRIIIDLSDILKQKAELFASMAYKRDISITSSIEPGIIAKADPLAIERIVNNLLDNAIRYNRKGGSIDISLRADEDRITLRVADTGIGIEKEKLGKIFEPYFQISHEKRNIQGIGMGLSLVSSIVDSLGGKISVESEKGSGTTFTVIMKRHQLREGDRVSRELLSVKPADTLSFHIGTEDSEAENRGHCVLLVEDNRDLLNLMRDRLGRHYAVHAALNGIDALKRLGGIPIPDVIVSDIMMDGMDGYEFFDEVTKRGYRDIPFIFVTAKSRVDDRLEGLHKGAIDYIYKPFVMEELVSKIGSIIRYQELKKSVHEKDKFTSLGMLLAGISHEIFNPLSGITGPLDILKKLLENSELRDNEHVRKHFLNIEESVRKIEGIVNSIRILYSSKPLEKEKVTLREIAIEALDEFRGEHGVRIQFAADVENDTTLPANREALSQILRNLIANAVDSIGERGAVTVSAKEANGSVMIQVSDNGRGIAPGEQERIFNAFYTTKEVGRGMGLGLNIVKNLSMKMNWEISVDSAHGRGTTFTITTGE